MSVPFRNPAPMPASISMWTLLFTNRISRCSKREAYLYKFDFLFSCTCSHMKNTRVSHIQSLRIEAFEAFVEFVVLCGDVKIMRP